MQGKHDDLNKAIILLLGFGTHSSPQDDQARLIEAFGDTYAAELESQVSVLTSEMGGIKIDWSVDSLVSASTRVRTIMQSRHPELTSAAIDALEWKFTFDWR